MTQEIEQIIARDLSGEASDEDAAVLSEWIATSEANKTAYLRCKAYWQAKVTGDAVRDEEILCTQLLERIRQSKNNTRAVFAQWLRYAGVAAAVAILVGLSTYWAVSSQKSPPINYYSFITSEEIATFYLPDSTKITLNKNSKLTFSNVYGVNVREVMLEGEAFFNVVKNREKTFVVSLDESRITVLGTAFNVKYRSGEPVLTTTLIEGAIQFETDGQSVKLKPNQQLVCNLSDHHINIDEVASEVATAWKDNVLKYKSIPFSELLDILEKRYGVTIRLANRELGTRIVTGGFDAHLSVEQILNLTKKNVAFRWKKEGDKSYVVSK
ncbi:MAG: FecR domain-containing protein [Tannerella sp.]|jgi:ferric-dicitrate binding protein FerR (iron transport regulator)|nr:FecR domain-containing protein [Tannerella sp.]